MSAARSQRCRFAVDGGYLFHAAFSGDVAVTELLELHGGGQDYTPALLAAAWKDRPAMAEWLIDRGAALNGTDFQGRTPLGLALELGNTAVAGVLRAAGAPEGA